LGRLTDAAEVVLSELFTNALQHACPPRGHQIETRYQRADAGVRIEVRDGSTDRPVMRRDSRTAESGRGLPLVDDITEGRWGVSERGEDGKSVWALVTGGRQDEGPR
jgi:two-component sensor histidine kinase